jgi:predicted RNA-binding protein
MCEAIVYFERDGELEELMQDVVDLRPEEGKILLTGVFGDQKLVSARIKEVKLLDHKIILRET